jgi:hypothetical protein
MIKLQKPEPEKIFEFFTVFVVPSEMKFEAWPVRVKILTSLQVQDNRKYNEVVEAGTGENFKCYRFGRPQQNKIGGRTGKV